MQMVYKKQVVIEHKRGNYDILGGCMNRKKQEPGTSGSK
jgi:hypothetical protein